MSPFRRGLTLAATLAVLTFLARLPGVLAHTVATSIYCEHLQYIIVKRIARTGLNDASSHAAADSETECLVVESAAELRRLASEIPPAFRDSVGDLERRLAQGCVVCLARRPRSDGIGKTVVGYEVAEPGVFSALGRRLILPADVIFSHWVEVLPACRGQRIHGLLFATRDAYFGQRGGRILCGVVAPKNEASRKALQRDGAAIVGIVRRVALFRSLIVWGPALDHIEAALGVAPGTSRAEAEKAFDVPNALRNIKA